VPNELTIKQIEEIAFAVLRSHNDDRLWRALTYESGPYDVTNATLALQDIASAFFRAGLASAPAAPAQAVPTEAQVLAAARELCKIHAGQCQVDEQDTWKVYGDQFKDDARAALTVAFAVGSK